MLTKKPRRGAFDYLLDGNSVHVDPPPPPRWDGPGRIRVEIEIVDRKRGQNKDNLFVSVASSVLMFIWLLVLVFAVIASLSHARGEDRWIPNRVGSQTYWYNPDTGMKGQEWTMPDGSVRSMWQDQRGHVTNCAVQAFGNAISRRCQ